MTQTTTAGDRGADVADTFAEFERAAAGCPGLTDLLAVYGEQEASVRQADSYLAVLNPPVSFTTNDSSV